MCRSAAAASACLYFPPNQYLEPTGGVAVDDLDYFVTQSQCAQEGGSWTSSIDLCTYAYPSSVIVHFTPVASYAFTQSAHCDAALFTHTVDDHGAIILAEAAAVAAQEVMTGNNATYIVSVTPGG